MFERECEGINSCCVQLFVGLEVKVSWLKNSNSQKSSASTPGHPGFLDGSLRKTGQDLASRFLECCP